MAFFENDNQPTGAWAFIQVLRMPVPAILARALALVGVTCACGCGDYHTAGPEAWWHQAIGGKIAEARPPPPGDKDPYPNLATMPAKPAAVNAAEWNLMTAGLMTDRLKAEQAAALAPIPAASTGAPASGPLASGPQARQASQPSPGPNQGGPNQGGPNPGGQDEGASAALMAAGPPSPAVEKIPKAPAPAATGAVPATRTPVGGAPGLSQPSPTTSPPGAAAAPGSARPAQAAGAALSGQAVLVPPGTSAAAAQRVANGQLPSLPAGEPARPGIAPAPPPSLVPLTAIPPASAAGGGGIGVDFSRGSAALNDPALAEVKAIAAARGDRGIAITGYGEASASDAFAQADAADLGLSRARALATALVAQGVPNAMLRLSAESAGRGASLRLLQ